MRVTKTLCHNVTVDRISRESVRATLHLMVKCFLCTDDGPEQRVDATGNGRLVQRSSTAPVSA
jgi:hypothetical protein